MSGGVKRVLVLDAGGYGVSPRQVGRTRFESREPTAEELDARDAQRDLARARVAAGLSPDGMATVTTSRGTSSYDPEDEGDVLRVRNIIAAEDGPEAAEAWQPHPGAADTAPPTPDPDRERNSCPYCPAVFPTFPPLRRHVQLHHPDHDPPLEPEPPRPEPVPGAPEPEPEPEPEPPLTVDDYLEDGVPFLKIPPWIRS